MNETQRTMIIQARVDMEAQSAALALAERELFRACEVAAGLPLVDPSREDEPPASAGEREAKRTCAWARRDAAVVVVRDRSESLLRAKAYLEYLTAAEMAEARMAGE